MKTKRLMTGTLLALVMITYILRQPINLTDLCLLQCLRDQTQRTIEIQRGLDLQFPLLLIHSKNRLNHSTNCSCQVYTIYLFDLDDSLLILENKVFFETYVHYLNCLKDKDPITFPF